MSQSLTVYSERLIGKTVTVRIIIKMLWILNLVMQQLHMTASKKFIVFFTHLSLNISLLKTEATFTNF